ncbi:MAG: hypothetical protein H0Z40_08225 [Desulfotomaculum sp.]|nr:hypothetical protein [Desulfotomaculum sp.]
MANVVEAAKELGLGGKYDAYSLVKCCCLFLVGAFIGVGLAFCGILPFHLLGVWIFLMVVLICCCLGGYFGC